MSRQSCINQYVQRLMLDALCVIHFVTRSTYYVMTCKYSIETAHNSHMLNLQQRLHKTQVEKWSITPGHKVFFNHVQIYAGWMLYYTVTQLHSYIRTLETRGGQVEAQRDPLEAWEGEKLRSCSRRQLFQHCFSINKDKCRQIGCRVEQICSHKKTTIGYINVKVPMENGDEMCGFLLSDC